MYKKEVRIKCEDNGKEYIVTELVGSGYEDLVDRRIFKSHQDAQYTLMALKRGSKFALEHGLACPADLKNAIKKIKTCRCIESGMRNKAVANKESRRIETMETIYDGMKGWTKEDSRRGLREFVNLEVLSGNSSYTFDEVSTESHFNQLLTFMARDLERVVK